MRDMGGRNLIITEEKKANFAITKSLSEVYRLKINSHRCAWATITINESGDFNAITDCGNFNYAWRGFGEKGFKDFLIKIMSKAEAGGYLYEKISDDSRNRVDCKKTIENMIPDFVERYQDLYTTYKYKVRGFERNQMQEAAKETYAKLIEIKNEGNLSFDRFYSIMYEHSEISNLFFDGEYMSHCLVVETTGDRQAIAFCEVVAPIFAEVLRQETQKS